MASFEGSVAWITGGGSGIGRALGLELARRGATVALSGRRRERLDEVAAEIAAAGGRALAVPCDVTSEASVDAAVERIVGEYGRLDLVIANAGYAASGSVEETPLEIWRKQFETNVFATIATVRRALPELRRQRGRVVLVGSVAAFLPLPKGGPYGASKAAVAAIGATLSAELAGSGVSCTTVHPGFVESEISKVDSTGAFDASRRERRPRQLLWKTEDAARVIVDAAERRERELVFTLHGKLAAAVGRHVPGLVQAALSLRRPGRDQARVPSEPGTLELVAVEPVELPQEPLPALLFARAARVATRKPQGRVRGGFPALEVRRPAVTVPRERIAAYRDVCRMPGSPEELPLTFPEVLFLGTLGTLITSESFPLSPFGLIHVRQTITSHRPLHAGERLDLSARLAEARRTPRGIELDVRLDVASGGSLAWEATTTLLSRAEGARSGEGRTREGTATPREGGEVIDVPEQTGRAYARVSGDWNPHHLWTFTARPLGYRRPIAHGMWSLALLLGRIPPARLAGPIHVEAAFKRPIFMPGQVAISVEERDGGWQLDAWDPSSGAPHVIGRAAAP